MSCGTEKEILKSLIDSTEETKKEVYTKTLRECIDLVNESLKISDSQTKEKLLNVKDRLLNDTSEINEDYFKNISKLVPTKYITDKVMDLKRSVTDKDNNLINNLQSLSFSKDSVILQLLAEHPEFQSIFSISHVGLEAMKEAGKPVYGKSGITDVSDLDYFHKQVNLFMENLELQMCQT